MKSGLLFALTALLAFFAGLVLSPLRRPAVSAEKRETFLAAPAGDSAPAHPTSRRRVLPLANDQHVPQTTAEIISGFQQAANESNPFRRLGHMWWLSEKLTPENAKQVAQETLESSKGMQRDTFVIGSLFAGWANVDPLAALDYAQTLPKNQREQALTGALMEWAGNDFDAASAWLDKLPPSELKQNAQQMLISTLAESDPERALEVVMESKSSGSRFSFAYPIFSSLAKQDPEAAAERAASLPEGRFRSTALRVVADNWSQSDRASAMQWIDELPEGPAKQQATSGAVQNWARTDFDGAFAWLQERPEGTNRNRLIQELTYSVTDENPENAIKLVGLLGSNSRQDQMLEDIARVWSRNDPSAAQQWAQSQTDDAVKKAIWEGVISGMAYESPQQAAALLQQLPPGQQSSSAGSIASYWANQDPAAAAEWSATLSGDARTHALGSVMSNWVRDDPPEALKWFSSTTVGKERDDIIGRFAFSLADNDPNLAIQWTRSIADQKQRLDKLEALARNWMRNDSIRARAWVTNSELSPEAKKRLLDESK